MEMKDKVIKGLEHEISRANIPTCGTDFIDCVEVALLRDALALLKEQEPRVMTLEELKSCVRETIWFQVKSNHTMKQLTRDGIAALMFIGLLHNWNGYGTVWRCWTSRPTDEQRRATPWQE